MVLFLNLNSMLNLRWMLLVFCVIVVRGLGVQALVTSMAEILLNGILIMLLISLFLSFPMRVILFRRVVLRKATGVVTMLGRDAGVVTSASTCGVLCSCLGIIADVPGPMPCPVTQPTGHSPVWPVMLLNHIFRILTDLSSNRMFHIKSSSSLFYIWDFLLLTWSLLRICVNSLMLNIFFQELPFVFNTSLIVKCVLNLMNP